MSDVTPSWSLADAALLRQLRTQAGIDRASVARGTCLSLAQLCQLEDGGDSSFYSPAIKRAAGRRALAWLQSRHGAEHPTVQARLQPQVQTRVQMPLQTRLQEANARHPPAAHPPATHPPAQGRPRRAMPLQDLTASPVH